MLILLLGGDILIPITFLFILFPRESSLLIVSGFTDIKTGNQVTRSLYFNGIPTGQIPFVSNVMGTNFSEFLGIVPGALQNVGQKVWPANSGLEL